MKSSQGLQTINERIAMLIEYLKLKPAQFATLIGTYRQNIDYLLNGRQPGAEMLQKIKSGTNVNMNWLLTGEGNMIETTKNDITALSENPESEPYILNARLKGALSDQDIIELPMLDAVAMGSFSDNIYGDMYKLETGKTYKILKQPRHNYNKAMVMEIVGDSMLPNFRNGMKVIVREVPSGKWAYATGINAVSLKGGMFTIKRIVKNKDNAMTLRPDNPAFADEELTIPIADILVMFRVGEIVYSPAVQDL